MKVIRTIRDADIEGNVPVPSVYVERRAARAVVFDADKNVALLHATKMSYHKLPGGGIEEGEEIIEALKREAMEEIGCEIQNIRELGMIEEWRNLFEDEAPNGLHQISYCFIADISGEKGTPHLEQDEIEDGIETEWLSINEAIKTIEDEVSAEGYGIKFMRMRDLAFLKEARKS